MREIQFCSSSQDVNTFAKTLKESEFADDCRKQQQMRFSEDWVEKIADDILFEFNQLQQESDENRLRCSLEPEKGRSSNMLDYKQLKTQFKAFRKDRLVQIKQKLEPSKNKLRNLTPQQKKKVRDKALKDQKSNIRKEISAEIMRDFEKTKAQISRMGPIEKKFYRGVKKAGAISSNKDLSRACSPPAVAASHTD